MHTLYHNTDDIVHEHDVCDKNRTAPFKHNIFSLSRTVNKYLIISRFFFLEKQFFNFLNSAILVNW